MTIHLRFAADTAMLTLARWRSILERKPEDQRPPDYRLEGYCALVVDDEEGPSEELDTIGHRVHTVERTPVRARVCAIREAEWVAAQEVDARDRWSKAWEKDSKSGAALDQALVTEIYSQFNRRLSEFSAIVYYVASRTDGDRLEIRLRMDEANLEAWNRFVANTIGRAPPPCAIQVYDVRFGASDRETAVRGRATWERFVQSKMAACGGSYAIQASGDWDDISFS